MSGTQDMTGLAAGKSGAFVDKPIPESWSDEDVVEFLNGCLADFSSIATVELYLDGQSRVIARIWFRA